MTRRADHLRITRDELLAALRALGKRDENGKRLYDPANSHERADHLLLAFIGDDEVSIAFHAIDRWYE